MGAILVYVLVSCSSKWSPWRNDLGAGGSPPSRSSEQSQAGAGRRGDLPGQLSLLANCLAPLGKQVKRQRNPLAAVQ